MASFLVLYGSGQGQTAKVAERVGSVLADRGHEVSVRDVAAGDVAVDEFDAVLVGSPVNNRTHLPEVVEFVEANREALRTRPTAFFQLSLADLVPFGWAETEEIEYVNSFVERTEWRPDRVGCFAGAVKYTEYDPVTRFLFKLVSAVTTGDTDTSRDYEYTDWDEVEALAVDVATLVEGESGVRDEDAGGDAPAAGRAARVGRGFARVVAGVGLLFVLLGAAYWLVVRKRVLRRGTTATVDRR
jgi:menaquinone-dependent protoporphyrinogen oxidase